MDSGVPGTSADLRPRVRDLWRLALSTTGRDVTAPIPDDVPFRDLGGDSAAAVALGILLREETGIDLGRDAAYSHPTVSAQAEALAARMTGPVAAALPATPSTRHRITAWTRDDWPDHAIAIVGAAVRVPGAATLEEYRSLIDSGRTVIGAPPPSRGLAEPGGYLADVRSFDHRFFGISRADATLMDPQQRLTLELAWEALENAGYADRGRRPDDIGVFVGATRPDFDDIAGAAARLNGSLIALIANRVSYFLDLTGPSECVDTACSSSLVAVQRGCEALVARDCEMVLAGGVSVILTDRRHRLMRASQMISPTHACRPFDAAADGMVPGEGGGMVLLKRLADAARDGDPVLGVLTGWAVNNNGRGNGINSPSPAAQRAVLRKAWTRAAANPAECAYVEAHGTGTPAGDPMEVAALLDVLSGAPARSCGIGSVKGQIGHLEWAAGIAGLIKVVLALQERRLPPSGAFRTPHPELGLTLPGCSAYVVEQPVPWRGRGLAGVSSFGAGGTNCHVVVEAAPERKPVSPGRRDIVLTMGAHSAEALNRRLTDLAAVLARHPERAAALPRMARGRGVFTHRIALRVDGAQDTAALLQRGSAAAAEVTREEPVAILLRGRLNVDESWLHRATADDPRLGTPAKPESDQEASAASVSGETVEAMLTDLWWDRGLRPQYLVASGSGRDAVARWCGCGAAAHAGSGAVVYALDRGSRHGGVCSGYPDLRTAFAFIRSRSVRHLLVFGSPPGPGQVDTDGLDIHVAAEQAQPERETAADVVARLYLTGHDVALDDPAQAPAAPYLPTYPFQRVDCWPEMSTQTPASPITPEQDRADGAAAYVQRWQPRPPAEPERFPPGSVLILADSAGTAPILAERLADAGWSVEVESQDVLADRGTAAGRLLSSVDLVARLNTAPVTEIVWLTGLPDASGRPWASEFDRGPAALLYAARAMVRRKAGSPCRLTVVTAGALPVSVADAVDPAQTMTAGAVASLRKELGESAVQLIDVDRAETPIQWAAAIAAALRDSGTAFAQACRNGVWYEPTWTSLATERRGSLAVPGGSYLVTGGLGALGVATARWLADMAPVHLSLVVRGPVPESAGWGKDTRYQQLAALAEDLESAGGSLTVYDGDVTDPYAMARIVREVRARHGGVRGVVHAAGQAGDRAVARFEADGFAASSRAKVDGARILDELFADDDLDFFLLYGSVISRVGNVGQAEYAAANAYLETVTTRRRLRGRVGLTVSWSTWAGPGMAERSGFSARSAGSGLTPMAPTAALSALAGVAGTESPSVIVAASDFLDAGGRHPEHVPMSPGAAGSQTPAKPLGKRPPRLGGQQCMEIVAGLVAKRLGESSVDPDANFFDVGADSLDLIAVVEGANAALGTAAPTTIVFEAPTVRRLGGRLAELVGDDGPVRGAEAAGSGRGTPGPSTGPRGDDIAVVGMSCRFSGADNPDDFWRLVLSGQSRISEIESGRLYDQPETDLAAALLGAPFDFDPIAFRISPAEALYIDPQQRLALELAWEALERSGHAGRSLARTGVFMGAEPTRYADLLQVARYSAVGGANSTSLVANRVSYALRMGGPSLVCDTACSSSAVAIHLARTSLLLGECDIALAGGVKVFVDGRGFRVNTAAGLLSPRGRLEPFDRAADGYVRGEGGAILVLRRLRDALADGDTVLAVIKSSRIAHDAGDKVGLTAPSTPAQRRLLVDAWTDGGLAADRLAFVEAHGTGTRLGDAVELEALEAAARDYGIRSRPWVSSVKANIGHTEAAAGAASVSKAVLSLTAGMIPPHAVAGGDGAITSSGSLFRLPRAATPLDVPGPAQAVVSAFGFGGAIAQIVLEQAPDAPDIADVSPGPHLVPLSASTPSTLAAVGSNLLAWLEKSPSSSLAAVAKTLAVGRFALNCRRAYVVSSVNDLIEALRRDGEPRVESPGQPARVRVHATSSYRPTADDIRALIAFESARPVLGSESDLARRFERLWAADPREACGVTLRAVRAVLVQSAVEVVTDEDGAPGPSGDPGELLVELRPDGLRADILAALGRLFEAGADVDWGALWSACAVGCLPLPTYPFERRTYAPPKPVAGLPVAGPPAAGPPAAEGPTPPASSWSVVSAGWSPLDSGSAPSTRWRRLAWGTTGEHDRVRTCLSERLAVQCAPQSGGSPDAMLWLVPDPGPAADQAGWSNILATCRQLATTGIGRLVAVCSDHGSTAAAARRQAVAGLLAGFADEHQKIGVAVLNCDRVHDDQVQADRILTALDRLPVSGLFRLERRHDIDVLERRSVRPAVPRSGGGPPAGVAVVTGGLGGVGGSAALACADAGFGDVVLLGRDTAKGSAAVEALRARGTRVHVFAADVTDEDRLRDVLDEVRTRIGRVSAVVHAAGVFDHHLRSLAVKTAESVAPVLAAKVDGTLTLIKQLRADPPDVLVLCSSISAFGAGLAGGQADYVAANTFLDALAERGVDGMTRILAVRWPQWSGLGMAKGRSVSARAAQLGLGEIDPAAGEAILAELINSRQTGVVAVVPSPRTGFDASRLTEPDRGCAVPEPPPVVAAAGPPRGRDVTEQQWAADLVRDAVAKILAITTETVADDMSFLDLGLDSLGIADLAGSLENSLSAVVDPSEVLLNPTIRSLAARVVELSPAGREMGAPASASNVSVAEGPAPDPGIGPSAQPIAVVGMAGLFPGASSVDEFWRLLERGGSSITEVPKDRWDWRLTYNSRGGLGNSVSKWGGFLDRPWDFDHEHFGISRANAELIDPLQRLFLEVSWSALRDAAMVAEGAQRGGVFVGARSFTTGAARVPEDLARESVVGHAQNFIAARVAHHLDLHGPALVTDTACSSSLVAIHLAAQSIRNGECDFAIAGGVDLLAGPEVYTSLSSAGALSGQGRCMAFAAGADGYVPGEGAAAVVLKPLAAAHRDGDRIYAVLLGSAVNNDGHTIGLTTPSVHAQREVLAAAYDRAGVDPGTVGLIEAHGTGTPIGDPIEVKALSQVLDTRERVSDCALGAVKATIGHLHSAAGVAGFIKAALCLYHRTRLPIPSAHDPNPRLGLDATPFRLLKEAEEWKSDRPRRAGVSAFGFGGTNCHVVLGEAQGPTEPAATDEPCLVLLSGRSEAVVRAEAAALTAWADRIGAGEALGRRSWQLTSGRGRFRYRAAAHGDPSSVYGTLRRLSSGELPIAHPDLAGKVAFLYPGQGSHHVGMARELIACSPVFLTALEECASWFDPFLDMSIPATLQGIGDEERLRDTSIAQPLLFAVEYAMDVMWQSMGVRPAAVIGHSIGEFAAMVAAGILDGPDAARLVAERARLMAACPPGAMLGVRLGEDELTAALRGCPAPVDVAALNGPSDSAIAGDKASINAAAEWLQARGSQVIPLRVSHAFHSRLMEPAVAALATAAHRASFRPPSDVAFLSTVTGSRADNVGADYVGRQLRSPVRFGAAVRSAYAAGVTAFLEVGPGGTLARLARTTVGPEPLIVAGLARGRSEREAVAAAAGALWNHGIGIDPRPMLAGVPPTGLVPPYPFERVHCGAPRISGQAAHASFPPYVDDVQGDGDRRSARRRFRAGEAIMDDHTVRGHRILPGVSWLSMVIEALAEEDPAVQGTFENVAFIRPLITEPGGTPREATVELTPTGNTWRFEGSSTDGTDQTRHVRGSFVKTFVPARRVGFAELRARCQERLAADELYRRIRAQGIVHGPFYRCLRRAESNSVEAVAELVLEPEARNIRMPFLHPALLDGATTAGAAVVGHAPWSAGVPYIPFHIARMSVAGPLPVSVSCHYRAGRLDGELSVFDFDICSAEGEVLVSVDGFASKRVPDDWMPSANGSPVLRQVLWVPFDARGGSSS